MQVSERRGIMKQKKWKKRVLIVLMAFVVLLLTALIAISIYTGKMVAEGLLYQNEGNDTKGNSVKQLELWGYDLEQFQNTYVGKDFTLTASDGAVIPVTYFETDAECKEESLSKPVAILIHGAGGDRVFLAPLAEVYLQNGWNVLTFDQRGSGDHSDRKVSFGYFEALDVERLVTYAKDDLKADCVVVHGQSMGGATAALYAVTDHAKANADAVVLDSPVDSMERMFRGVYADMEGSDAIPVDYCVSCGDLYLRLFYHFSFADADVIKQMKRNDVKTLVILSEQDKLCTPEYVEQIYENIASKDKALVRVNSEHIKGVFDDPQGYISQVLAFVENVK